MRVAEVAIIHHRTPGILRRALQRLARHAPDVPVRVLDSGPAHERGELAAVVDGAHPRARLAPIANHSYSGAVNAALRAAPGPLIAVMNADVLVESDTLASLAAPFHDPRVAASGPLARTPDGRLQDQGPAYRRLALTLRGRGPHVVLDVPWLSGCLFVARVAAARDAGGLDPSLRFLNEDLEWGLRLRARGWRCLLVGAEVEHLGGASTPDAARFWVEGLRGGMQVARRHHGPARRLAQRAAVGAYAALRARTGSADSRRAWRAVARMMRRGAFEASPFGATLADDAPGFPDAWPPEAGA